MGFVFAAYAVVLYIMAFLYAVVKWEIIEKINCVVE